MDILNRAQQLAQGESLIVILAVMGYLFLFFVIVYDKGKGQSALTWFLWTILDIAQYIVTKEEGGDSANLLLIFAIGGTIITISLFLLKIKGEWKNTETIIVISVITCIVLWKILESEYKYFSVIAFCIAQFVAGIPLLKEARKNPNELYIVPNLCFILINVFAICIAKSWNVEDTLLSIVLIFFGAILQYFLWKKLLQQEKLYQTL